MTKIQIDILRLRIQDSINELQRTLIVLNNLLEELDEDKELDEIQS